MLNIIYSRHSSGNNKATQGKKTLVKFLSDDYGVLTIKKYTNQNKPERETDADPNLIYLGFCQKEEDFIEAVRSYDDENGIQCDVADEKFIYIYTQVKHDTTYFYGIKRADVFNALRDYETHYALVCTNIGCLRTIKDDADQERLLCRRLDGKDVFQLRAYCLVRQNKDNSVAEDTENEANSLLNNIMQMLVERFKKGSESNDDDLQRLVDKYIKSNLSDGRPYFLPYGEALELDFFRNVALFSNLLLIPECGDLKSEKGRNSYRDSVGSIVEKYMGLKKQSDRKKKVFIVHPMSPCKFSLKTDDENQIINTPLLSKDGKAIEQNLITKQFHLLIQTVFKCNDDAYELCFAQDVQYSHHGTKDLIPKILAEIRNADIVISDLSNFNQNCIYEAGFAYALQGVNDKEVYFLIPSQQMPLLSRLCFDINGIDWIDYNLQTMIGSFDDVKSQVERIRKKIKLPDVVLKKKLCQPLTEYPKA